MKSNRGARPRQRRAEQLALQALLRSLTMVSKVGNVAVDGSITDDPDAVIIVNGQRTAIDCTYITPSKVLEAFFHRAERLGKMYDVVVPHEPHLWVSSAVSKKASKVPEYLRNGRASEAWLLLHTAEAGQLLRLGRLSEPERRRLFELLRAGAHDPQHDFKRIWLAELAEPRGLAVELFGPYLPKPTIDPEEYLRGFAEFPYDVFKQGKMTVTAVTKDTISFDMPELKTIFARPLDARHVVNKGSYSAIPIAKRIEQMVGGEVFLADGYQPV